MSEGGIMSCIICGAECDTTMNGYCADCFTKCSKNEKHKVILCPTCTEGVTDEEAATIINILKEYHSKLEFEYCRKHDKGDEEI